MVDVGGGLGHALLCAADYLDPPRTAECPRVSKSVDRDGITL
jgi:hypothetical protein